LDVVSEASVPAHIHEAIQEELKIEEENQRRAEETRRQRNVYVYKLGTRKTIVEDYQNSLQDLKLKIIDAFELENASSNNIRLWKYDHMANNFEFPVEGAPTDTIQQLQI
jgi:hypothetical protein